MEVEVACRMTLEGDLGCERVRALALEILKLAGAPESSELSVLLTNDDEIRRLNRTFRGVDRPTDVLSFPMNEDGGPGPGGLLGDVVISIDTVARQALERGHEVAHEFAFILLHGVLHLLGHDHGTRGEAEAMDARTREIWAALSIRRAGAPADLPSSLVEALASERQAEARLSRK